jgi:hypothetical protein
MDPSQFGIQFTGNTISTNPSPGMIAFEKYLYEQLQKALYGEIKKDAVNKRVKVVDQYVFLQLFQGQLSKNVLATVSSYCIEADEENLISDDKVKREQQRENNIKGLSNFVTKNGKTLPEAHRKWVSCFKSLQPICENTNVQGVYDYSTLSNTNKDHQYSIYRACLVTGQLKRLRQALIQLMPIDEAFKKQKLHGFNDTGYEIYRGGKGKDEKSVDELTTITSGDINRGFAKKQSEAATEFEKECTNGENNKDICKKYFITDDAKKDINSAIVADALHAEKMQKDINNISSSDDLKAFLKSEKRSKKQIERKIATEQSIEQTKKSIQVQYEREKENLIKYFAKRINAKTDNAANRVTILEELKNRTKDYARLIHYNNIVAGYLDIDTTPGSDQNSKEMIKNTALMFRELDDNAYSSAGRDVASGETTAPIQDSAVGNIEELKEKIEKIGIEKPEKSNGAVDLTVEQINETILDYGEK